MTTIDEDRRLVAEQLLGWRIHSHQKKDDTWLDAEGDYTIGLDYLTTWNGAGEVLEALRERGLCVELYGWEIFNCVVKDPENESAILADCDEDEAPDAVIRAAAQVCRDE